MPLSDVARPAVLERVCRQARRIVFASDGTRRPRTRSARVSVDNDVRRTFIRSIFFQIFLYIRPTVGRSPVRLPARVASYAES